MKQINISSWKEFHLYDIFDIDSGTKLDKIKMKNENPTINFVGRANFNNGITTRVDEIKGIKPYKEGNLTLALGGSYLGACFIQTEPFYTSQNVVVLMPKEEISFYTKQFIASVIFKESQLHYKAFLDELNPHIKTDFVIKLPVDSEGKPDYQYMHKYIEKQYNQYNKNVDTFKEIKLLDKQKIDIQNWKSFKIKDIFKTEQKGKQLQVPTGYMISKKHIKEGNIPRITVSGVNNGITGYFDSDHKDFRVYENFISISFLGTVFYQQQKASLDMKVHCLQLKDRPLNLFLGLFLVTIIRESIQNSSYSDQISSTVVPNLDIMLPIDKEGNPDYQYMELYIKNKLKIYKNYFNKL